MSPAPTRPYLAPFNTIGFEHQEDQSWRSQPRESEPILAIMYDKSDCPTHVLTTRTDYGLTYCADGPVVRDAHAGCIHLDAANNFMLDDWGPRRSRPQRVWLQPHILGQFSLKGVPLSRQDAANLGWIQIDTPLPQSKPVDYHNDIGNLDIYNPLKDTTSADYIHHHWCSICQEHYTSEGPCHHTKWRDGDGFTLGCGGEDVDIAEARTSVHHLLRLLPPDTVQRIYEQLLEGTFSMRNSNDFSICDRSEIECACSKTRKITHRPEGRAPYETNLFWHTLEIDHDELALKESEAEKLYWPGLAWLGSLDRPGRKGGTRTQAPYALTLGWVFEFLHNGHSDRLCLSIEKLHLEIPAAKFDQLAALDPNDYEPLAEPEHWIEFRQTDLDRTANTHHFLAAPDKCQFVHLVRARKRKTDDYQSLTYLVDLCEAAHPKGHRTTRYRIRLARCLNHNGKHPSAWEDSYRLIRQPCHPPTAPAATTTCCFSSCPNTASSASWITGSTATPAPSRLAAMSAPPATSPANPKACASPTSPPNLAASATPAASI